MVVVDTRLAIIRSIIHAYNSLHLLSARLVSCRLTHQCFFILIKSTIGRLTLTCIVAPKNVRDYGEMINGLEMDA